MSQKLDFGSGVKISNKLYTEDEVMKDKNAEKAEMKVSAIPDLELLLQNIIELVEMMETPEMDTVRQTDKSRYENIIITKYQDCMPYSMIKLLLQDRHNNLPKIIKMIETLSDVKAGKADINEEYDKFGEKLNEEYLYPKFGGKEATYKFFTENANKQK